MCEQQDKRLQQIKDWLQHILTDGPFTIEIASSDASFRRYFRVRQQEKSWIVMDAPPEHEDIAPFVKVAEFLYQHNINVPQIFARDLKLGFLLLTDFGNQPCLSALNEHNADSLYKLAIDEIIRMQSTPAEQIALPDYNENLLQIELDLFTDWFLQCHLNLSAPAGLSDICHLLINEARQQPQCFVHRDYHSRNLMLLPENRIGIIDFQDAVTGPVSYDLVSLLRDCYIEWPMTRIKSWLLYYYQQALHYKLISGKTGFDKLQRWFDLMGLQRHLKVLGIFCRLNYRDGKENYMNDLPLTLRYVLEVSTCYPELKALSSFLTHTPRIMAIL